MFFLRLYGSFWPFFRPCARLFSRLFFLKAGVFFGFTFGFFFVELFFVLGGVGLLAEAFDALIAGEGVVEHFAEAGVVFGFFFLMRVGIFAFYIAFLVTVFIIIKYVFV